MERYELISMLDHAHDAAHAAVIASPKSSCRELEALFDKVFFRFLADRIGNKTVAEVARLVSEE